MKRFLGLSVLFAAFGSYACSSDGGPSAALQGLDGGLGAGGGSGAAGSENGGGAGGGTGTALGCDKVAPAHRVASVYGGAKSLRASGNDLFLFDKGDGPGPTILRRIDAAGKATAVHDSGPDCTPTGLALGKADAFFFDYCTDETATLNRIPMAGGTVTPVLPVPAGNYGGLDVIQVTDQYAYVYRAGNPDNVISRIALADGSIKEVVRHEGLAFENMQVLGTDVWFGAGGGLDGAVRAPLDGSNPSGAPAVDLKTCVFTFGATNAGLFCSDPLSLYRIGLNGQDRTSVLDLSGGPVNVSHADGDFIYLLPLGSPGDPHPLMKYPVKGGTPKVLACSTANVTEFAFNETTVFWLETDDQLNGVIYSAPK